MAEMGTTPLDRRYRLPRRGASPARVAVVTRRGLAHVARVPLVPAAARAGARRDERVGIDGIEPRVAPATATRRAARAGARPACRSRSPSSRCCFAASGEALALVSAACAASSRASDPRDARRRGRPRDELDPAARRRRRGRRASRRSCAARVVTRLGEGVDARAAAAAGPDRARAQRAHRLPPRARGARRRADARGRDERGARRRERRGVPRRGRVVVRLRDAPALAATRRRELTRRGVGALDDGDARARRRRRLDRADRRRASARASTSAPSG